ncbi:MAG: FtsX-like permease family protein [Planctomycetaceae bacterium]|nr:FtsX-like permease family protein [Planctomycetaceae bacterium]
MYALDRKLLRDLWQLRTQSIAIALVIACGVGMTIMMLSTQRSLDQTRQEFYDRYRFGEVFVELKRAPEPLAQRFAEIPGLRDVQTRIVVSAFLDLESLPRPAIGKIVGVPTLTEPVLNRIHLRSGRPLDPLGTREAILSEAFAGEHGLQPGDVIRVILNGRLQAMTIVGVALSPESIYEIQPGQIIPDPASYGVLWMSEQELAAAYDMDGAFNSASFTLLRGASIPEVIRQIDLLTDEYGGAGAYARRDQLSHKFLEHEMQQLRSMGTVVPVIFLSVAAFLLNIVLSRLIHTQREQIAVLKAFGYSGTQIGAHFLVLTLLISLLGALLGTAMGTVMGRGLTQLYTTMFHFPVFRFHLARDVVWYGWFVATGSGIIGAYSGLKNALSLPPAEAMRPEPPANYRRSLLEVIGLAPLMSPIARMIVRQLERTPRRTLMSIIGVSLATAVIVLGNFSMDSVDQLMHLMFSETQRYDVLVAFAEPENRDVEQELRALPGVLRCEMFRGVPVRLRHGHHTRLVGIQGVTPGNDLYRFIDAKQRVVELPPEGLLISAELARLLDVTPGGEVRVEVLEGSRKKFPVRVAARLDDFSGLSAFLEIEILGRLIGEPQTVSGAYLQVDRTEEAEVLSKLKEHPAVAGVNLKRSTVESFQETIAENLLTMRLVNLMFAAIIAMGVIYNTARIALSERTRELATLRVLGFTRGEISSILLGELAAITAAGLPLGCGLGYLFAMVTLQTVDRELFRIPLLVLPRTYLLAISGVVCSAVVAGLIVRRRLDHLDLIEVLKTRE